MKKLFFFCFALFFFLSLRAQTAEEEINRNACLSGSNYLAYPAPCKALTPQPKGKKPFYISHYGRHGSRYLIDPADYTRPIGALEKAAADGKLTAEGLDLLEKTKLMHAEAHKRLGELTELGAEQHRQIANRMYNRFPEVFSGDVTVDAKSTVVIRCILSMENELLELARLNPELCIVHDASEHDMHYMNFRDRALTDQRTNDATRHYLDNWRRDNLRPDAFIARIFTDMDYANENVDKVGFYQDIFYLANIIQNSEIRHRFSFYHLFTQADLYTLWQYNNLGWFMEFGANKLNGSRQPFTQRKLLGKIISEADSCIALPRPGATLRFGHETMVLPLVCLLNLNGYGEELHPSQLLERQWYNYRIFPMGCNVQFVFYRKNPADTDVWVKVLLNEEEATLPLQAVSGPYYRWQEVRQYYMEKINSFETSFSIQQ